MRFYTTSAKYADVLQVKGSVVHKQTHWMEIHKSDSLVTSFELNMTQLWNSEHEMSQIHFPLWIELKLQLKLILFFFPLFGGGGRRGILILLSVNYKYFLQIFLTELYRFFIPLFSLKIWSLQVSSRVLHKASVVSRVADNW